LESPLSVPIRIVHVLYSLDVGGLENGVVNLINNLDWQKYEHTLCCLTHAGRLLKRVRRTDVEVVEMGKRDGHDWSLLLRLARLLRKLRPHVVHTRNWGTMDAIPVARLSGVPALVHGEHGRTMAEVNGENRRRTMIRKTLFPLVHCFVTVSRELTDWLQASAGVAPRKIRTICNGVDLARFARPRSRLLARSELGFTDEEFVIGTVGRLDLIKNQASLIQVVPDLIAEFPQLRLVIVGSGPCLSSLELLVKQFDLAGKILLTGEKDDVVPLMQAFDVFALPSLFEGISNTVLEAMACGLPVIATRVGGNIELVEEGVTGLLIPQQDQGALRNSLRSYLEQPSLARVHGTGGRQRVEQKFSLNRMVSAYDEMYSTLISMG